MLTKSRALSFVAVSVALVAVLSSFVSSSVDAQDAPVAAPTPVVELDQYAGVDVRAGVWSDGQAALWDLNILDHFRIFGAQSRARGYAPEQPIKFSHVVHVQKNKMECQYCHWSVSKAAYAAIPEVEACMGCHKIVKTDSPEIKKLKEYYDKGEPVPWVKVHVMPDHVFFNHKRHVKAGVACHECHGQIPRMPVVERASSMKMGWCVDCHRQKGTSIDCYTCHK